MPRHTLAALLLLLDVSALASPPPLAIRQPAEPTPREPQARRSGGRGFAQLPSSPALHVLRPERAWGTPRVVELLLELAAAHRLRFPDAPPLVVGDLSRERGGRLLPHRSHRHGRDVDVRLPQRGRRELRLLEASLRTLDLERTWFLIERLVRSGEVEYIFLDRRLQRALRRHARSASPPLASDDELSELFQYPRSPKRWIGIVRHEPGHSSHLHVRFRREVAAPPRVPPLVARSR